MPQNARNATASDTPQTSVAPYKSWAFDQYLTYCALGGMMVSDQGGISGKTLSDFCYEVGIDEKTTWRWKTQIPDFAMRVRQRREEIVPLARETAAWNRLFLIGMTSLPTGFKEVVNQKTGAVRMVPYGHKHEDQRAAVDALKTYVEQYGGRHGPTQRHEVKVEGDFLDMMAAAAKQGVIEGEVVDADVEPQANAGGSIQNPGALPPAS